jgi:hypothetical protein
VVVESAVVIETLKSSVDVASFCVVIKVFSVDVETEESLVEFIVEDELLVNSDEQLPGLTVKIPCIIDTQYGSLVFVSYIVMPSGEIFEPTMIFPVDNFVRYPTPFCTLAMNEQISFTAFTRVATIGLSLSVKYPDEFYPTASGIADCTFCAENPEYVEEESSPVSGFHL